MQIVYLLIILYWSWKNNKNIIKTKFKDSLNKADVKFVEERTNEEGNEVFINPEVLSEDSEGNEFNTFYPIRFYFCYLNNNNMYLSKLSIISIINHGDKLYLRQILIFRNYIHDWLSELFKNMDFRDLTTEKQIPDLSFVANVADFDLGKKH